MTPRPAVGDIDNRPQIPQTVLFRNRGDGTFEEIAAYAGVTACDWSWQPVFMDVDLDGWEDMVISTGFMHDVDDLDNMETMAETGQRRRAGPAETWRGWQADGAVPTGAEERGELPGEHDSRSHENSDGRLSQSGQFEIRRHRAAVGIGSAGDAQWDRPGRSG